MSASRIDRVTVFRVGARVERVMALEDGVSEVRFTQLPLALDDGSLRVRMQGTTTDGPIAADVRVGLEVPEEDASLAPAEDAALESARAEAERCRADVSRLELAVARLESLKVVARPPPRENEPPLPIPLESRQKLLALRTAEEKRLGADLAAAHAAARDAEKKLADATDVVKRATTSRNAKQHELRKVAIVTLAQGSRKAAAGVQVVLEYAIPHARWSASYVLTLPEAAEASRKPAKLGMRALVAQRSGEDWRGVKLRLSTAESGAWVELPELAKARIGRAQPHAKKAGYREPPEGAHALYADYDRIAGPPTEPPVPKAEVVREEETTPVRKSVAAFSGPPMGGGMAPHAPPAARPMPMPMSMPMSSPSRATSKGAGPVALLAAPIAALGSALRERAAAPQKAALEESEGGAFDDIEMPAEAAAEPEPDWSLATESLAYSRLRMRAPSDVSRGELTLVAQASVYVEALALAVRIDVAAAIHVAFNRAKVDESALPPGYELARTDDAYDYAYETALPCDVASDGTFHAVPVADWDAETKLRYVAAPREAPQVYRVLDISSPIDAALLAGPLDVYESTAQGKDDGEAMYRMTTRMPPAPPRGRVELGLGVEPAIKIARTTTFQEETAGLLGGSLALGHRVSVELRNLLPRPVTVEVRERVPVVRKDDAEVKVDVGAVEPSWEKWDQEQSLRGGYVWKVPLEPGATRTLSARYTIKIASKLELVGGNRRES